MMSSPIKKKQKLRQSFDCIICGDEDIHPIQMCVSCHTTMVCMSCFVDMINRARFQMRILTGTTKLFLANTRSIKCPTCRKGVRSLQSIADNPSHASFFQAGSYQCNYCNFECRYPQDLIKHTLSTKACLDKQLPCPHCREVKGDRITMKQHIMHECTQLHCKRCTEAPALTYKALYAHEVKHSFMNLHGLRSMIMYYIEIVDVAIENLEEDVHVQTNYGEFEILCKLNTFLTEHEAQANQLNQCCGEAQPDRQNDGKTGD